MIYTSGYVEGSFEATWSIGGGEQCCPVHSTAPPGASSLQECVCDAGYISNTGPGGGPPCTPAVVASANITFEPLNYTQLNCVACAAGLYLSQESLNCTACPAGSSTFDYRNASSALHCVCRPGFENQTILGQNGEKCEPCRQGFFKEQLANASCGICPRNSWTLDDGSANVSVCVCDAGFSKSHLATIPPGPEDHALPCEPCEPGFFKRTQADEACEPCPEHYYCPSDSSQGSIEPRACPTNSSAASPLPQVLVYETSASSRRAMRWRAVVEDCLCDAGFYFAVASVNNSIFECEYN